MDMSTLSKGKQNFLKVVFIALGILAICGIVCAFSLNYNTFLPSAPMVLDDGNSVLITTSINENYQGYRFRFRSAKEEIEIESDSNVLTEDNFSQSSLVVGTSYRVSVCYLGETDGSDTEYSDSVQWVYSVKLPTPRLTIDHSKQTIKWDEVEKADYYVVHYKDQGSYQSKIVTDLSFNYSDMSGGEKELYVVAHSVKAGYKNSEPTSTIRFTHTYKLKPIAEASLNKTTYDLTIKAEEQLDYLSVYINGVRHVAKLSDYVLSNNLYEYTINIVTKYSEDAVIGVAPYPADEYSSFVGNILYLS